MNKTSIQWTNYTLQLVRFRSKATGRTMNWCEKISPGCRGCYAERITRRFNGREHSYTPAGRDLVEPYLDREALRELVTTRRRGMVFVEDMSDLFGDWVPDAWLDECFAAFALSPLTIQVLTKRAERMSAYMTDPETPRRVMALKMARMCEPGGVGARVCVDVPVLWPLPNVWLGVSVESRAHLDRLDHLRATPAALRFVSFEPLLEDLGAVSRYIRCRRDHDHDGNCDQHPRGCPRIDLAIIGGESGKQARPCDVAWIRSLRDQCRAAGTKVFVKQLGANCAKDGGRLNLRDSHGGDPAEWPEDLRVRELPETIAFSTTEDAQPHRRKSRRSVSIETNGAATVPLHRGRSRRSSGAA